MHRTARMLLAATTALLVFSSLAGAETAPAAKTTPSVPSLKAVEGMTSTIFQQRQSSFSGIGLRLRVPLPQLINGFSVMPTVEYWRNTSTLDDFGLKASRKDATLGALLRYDVSREGLQPYFGAGFGLHFLSSHLDAPSLGFNDASNSVVKGGVALLGGLKFGLAGKLGNMIELEYHGIGEQSQLKFNWGLSYEF